MLTSFRLVTMGSLRFQDLLALAVSGKSAAKPGLFYWATETTTWAGGGSGKALKSDRSNTVLNR
jgi:hypothetical protein